MWKTCIIIVYLAKKSLDYESALFSKMADGGHLELELLRVLLPPLPRGTLQTMFFLKV